MTSIELPPEILFKIFELLPAGSLPSLAAVSRQWRPISINLLYTNIQHAAWKPRRVSACLNALAFNWDTSLAPTVRNLDLRLWSIDPQFARLLLEALMKTTSVTKLKLAMAERFAENLEDLLLHEQIIAADSVDESPYQAWTKRFLPNLQHLELSSGHLPFRLAAGRPVRTVVSSTHIDLDALRSLLPFLQRSRGPLQSVHFNVTGRDARVASNALKLVARKLPCLTHVFFNFFVGKRITPPKYTPDLLEDLAPLSSLHTVELLLSRHARSPDTYLYSHFAAVHTLKATAPHLTTVVLDTIHWQYASPHAREYTHTPATSIASSNSSPHSSSPPESSADPFSGPTSRPPISKFEDTENLTHTTHASISSGTYGWSPEPADVRTHAWWLSQYGNQVAAHAAMLSLWGNRDKGCGGLGQGPEYMCIPDPHEIGMGLYPDHGYSMSNESMSIYEHEHPHEI
ncbi:hypothetical protein M422DRAFT_263039 [Sphaerobolus stellatus SS14]|uniref:F-box domain-containing protein n=1 Tax=Sphaerobolus stellatus (strain SS14) TaxID=990650 RepID=A0A0C9VBJ0_SPHS4|nr:hypothetical protein M422DRAFT_263039 [Sphaerobolus stellatus SS14]